MLNIETIRATVPVTEYIREYRDAEKFIGFCRECRNYNSCWACPPFDFEPLDRISGYETLYLVGTKIRLAESVRNEPRSREENQVFSRRILADVRKDLDDELLALEGQYPGSRAFFAGTCFSCPNGTCTRIKGAPCVQPERLRHSLEAFGFDIGKTASELLNIELKWSSDGSLPEYFTLVSGVFSNDHISELA